MFQLNDGRVVDASTSIEYPAGVLRPPGWIASLSASEKSELGISDWTPPAYTPATPDLATAKKEAIKQVKQQANAALSPTDWLVIRKTEVGTPIPAEWDAYRTDVRVVANEIEKSINEAASVEQVNSAKSVEWPIDPETEKTHMPLKRSENTEARERGV
jgi:hypothetical protein